MKVTQTALKGVLQIDSDVHHDERGYFMEAWHVDRFAALAPELAKPWVQDNLSLSQQYVFRGMHLQSAPHAQAKLVRCLKGEILDIVLDVEPGSATYGQSIAVSLTGVGGRALYIPAGYAHGFVALTPEALLYYKVDHGYHPESEVTYHYDMVSEHLSQIVSLDRLIISPKDRLGISLTNSR